MTDEPLSDGLRAVANAHRRPGQTTGKPDRSAEDPLSHRDEFTDVMALAEARLIVGACSAIAGWGVDAAERRLLAVLLAVRDQAATEARRELLAKVEGLRSDDYGLFSGDIVDGWLAHRRAVLALIEEGVTP